MLRINCLVCFGIAGVAKCRCGLGRRTTLYVRGMGTLNSKSPLILVDGFERSLKELSSEEIESVSVLKDAVATSLYSIRGANGVILVKTKRGSLTSPQINFFYEFNMATRSVYPIL